MRPHHIIPLLLLTLGLGAFRAQEAKGADLLVEAESFARKGGWQIDQQFMDLMGSPYLIAHGMGVPVGDASTEVRFPEAGDYYVYARTYNWTSPWSDAPGPGRFVVALNGKRIGRPVGDKGDAWGWQPLGKVRVVELDATLTLHDLTGFDGRCDALYFTTAAGALPPESLAEQQAFRRAKLGLPEVAPSAGEFDLVVAGGGIAGMSAALAAARLGLRVALINDRPVLGGNNSSEIRVHLGGRIESAPYERLGDLQKEFGPRRGGNAKPAERYEDARKDSIIAAEPLITLFANCRVTSVKTAGDRIVSLVGQDIANGSELTFEAPLFADCTGDATVGFLAGADWRMGREARSEFGESEAPEAADAMTMGASVQWYSEAGDAPSAFPKFSYGVSFDEANCERVTMGEWTWETGMNRNQISDFERIRDYGLLVVYSNWSFLKNGIKDNADYRNHRLAWVAYVAGKRESRRLLGDYILKQDDLVKQVFHEDGTASTTWSIDLHYPDSINSLRFPEGEFKSVARHIAIYPYPIPYRCLYSRNVTNLFMAGRNISVTHVALGTVRVMRTAGMMGEVVGMAAKLCTEHGVLPRDIYQHHLSELQELMRQGVGRGSLPNNQRYNQGRTLLKD